VELHHIEYSPVDIRLPSFKFFSTLDVRPSTVDALHPFSARRWEIVRRAVCIEHRELKRTRELIIGCRLSNIEENQWWRGLLVLSKITRSATRRSHQCRPGSRP
jgi:hypothetical protein